MIMAFVNADDRSLTEVFKLFDVIHILTTDHTSVKRIAKEVGLFVYCIVYCLCCKFIALAFMQATSKSRLLKILHQRMLCIWS